MDVGEIQDGRISLMMSVQESQSTQIKLPADTNDILLNLTPLTMFMNTIPEDSKSTERFLETQSINMES